eukprot:COSAG06_NODE_7221_length_2582_cov_1.709223_2_plen_105_part_00
MELLRRLPASNFMRQGRVSKILDSGAELQFADGSVVALPFGGGDAATTTFVHCSAGAFNFSQTASEVAPAVWEEGKITLQEIFNYPGFCFNGCVIAYLECDKSL